MGFFSPYVGKTLIHVGNFFIHVRGLFLFIWGDLFRMRACPGIRKRGGGAQNLKAFFFFFFFAFQFFRGGGPAQKIAEKMIFSIKKVAKSR